MGETVNRLNFQSARTVEDLRKKLPRSLASPRIGRFPEMIEVGCKLRVLEPHPGRKAGADAVRHFGRCGLGEGKTEDRFRPRSFQEQPQDTRRQHLRLARPSGRGQSRVHPRIGCECLLVLQFRQRLEALAHAALIAIEERS